jgi:hypothetical protein
MIINTKSRKRKILTVKEKRRLTKKKVIKEYWKNLRLKKKSVPITEEFINSLCESKCDVPS